MIHTIETRLKLNETQELLVNSCVVLWSSYYRKTWKLWNNQQLKENEIYHQLMGLNLFTDVDVQKEKVAKSTKPTITRKRKKKDE